MSLKGQNIIRAKQTNRSRVLQSLLRYGPTSRQHIAEMTQLTSATISHLTAELIEEGLIREVGYLQEEEKKVGRKFIALALNGDASWVVGIHIHVSQVELGLINLHGLIKKTRQFPLSPGINEAAFTEMLIKELKAFISDINDVQIAAVGIGCLGLISFDKGEILNVEPLGWGPVPLAVQITNAVQLPVYIDNNVRAMTLAEKMFGESKQVSDFLCIYIGEGIGSGLILNDRLYRGGPTGSGEFGHMTYMPDGISCWCGNRGCLEQYASNTAISRQLQASWPRVLHAFEQGDSETVQAMRQAGRAIGTVLASYINILHVEKVVVAGVMAGPGFPLISELKKEIEWRSFLFKREKVQIESSSFGEHIGLIGAASLALQHEIFIR